MGAIAEMPDDESPEKATIRRLKKTGGNASILPFIHEELGVVIHPGSIITTDCGCVGRHMYTVGTDGYATNPTSIMKIMKPCFSCKSRNRKFVRYNTWDILDVKPGRVHDAWENMKKEQSK